MDNIFKENKNIKTNKSDSCCSTHDEHSHSDSDGHDHDHDHSHGDGSYFQMLFPAVISFCLLLIGIVFDNYFPQTWFSGWVRLGWYILAYIPVGLPVLKEAFESFSKGSLFSEFFLMGIATIGAFAIGEFPEGVAVMLFYSIGEIFQSLAVKRAKSNIKLLLDQRPDSATVLDGNKTVSKKASEIEIGTIIQLKPGEKLALDGKLLSESATFNTAALTGESKPDTKKKNEIVLAGMINLNTVIEVEVTTAYTDSKLSKILKMVQEATAKKAPTELFIRKFAKVYTPIVVYLAMAICLLPMFFVADYVFKDWLYRALVFLGGFVSLCFGDFYSVGVFWRNRSC